MKAELKKSYEELKMEMRNMKEHFVHFSTSGIINVDDSGSSFSEIQTLTFNEIAYGGKAKEEVTILEEQNIDCGRRIQELEEELDMLAGQVQSLEEAKPRVEMTLESKRKEAKKKAQMKDEELEAVQCNAQKKVQALEAQLNHECEERTLVLKEKHVFEGSLSAAIEPELHDKEDNAVLLQTEEEPEEDKRFV